MSVEIRQVQNSDSQCHLIYIRTYQIMAAVTSGLLTIIKTGITIVSYFGNVTASLFTLTIVRKFMPW